MRGLLIIFSLLFSLALFVFIGFDREAPPTAADRVKIDSPSLTQNSFARQAKRMTLRIRSSACRGLSVGSAFVIQKNLLITNRHVIDNTEELEANTWDGRSLPIDIKKARVSKALDIGFIELNKELKVAAKPGGRAPRGEALTIVGYPKGGELTLSPGRLQGYVSAKKISGKDYPGQIMVLKASVRRGNSGGPVLDQNGRVIAVIFAASLKKGRTLAAYAIPIGQALALSKGEDMRPPRGC